MTMNKPLTEQDLINVKDEHRLVMDIFHEFEGLAKEYAKECAKINEEYDRTLKEIDREMEVIHNESKNDFEKRLSALEREKNLKVNRWDEEFKSAQKDNQQKREQAQKEREAVIDNASMYKIDISYKINEEKKKLTEYMDMITEAENAIATKKYFKIIAMNQMKVPVEGESLKELVQRNPMRMVLAINQLDDQVIDRFRHGAELKEKSIEFYSYKCKAVDIYKREMAKLNSIMPDVEKEIFDKTEEAARRMKEAVAKLDEEMARRKEEYVAKSTETEVEFNRNKEKITEEYTAKCVEADKSAEERRTQALLVMNHSLPQALKRYQESNIQMLPPHLLKKLADMLMAEKINSVADYELKKEEPQNCTVGFVYFMFKQFLPDEASLKFMTANYEFILKKGCFILPYALAVNESLALCYEYDNAGAETAGQTMQTICMKLLLDTPPNKIRFHFFDPLKSGQTFAMFKHFEEENSSGVKIIMGGIHTEEHDIEQQLQVIVDHIKSMQVNNFKGQYSNIREYNAANKLNPQPYNIVGIMDFPAGFSKRAIELLSQVVATGKACGVYTIVMCAKEQMWNVEYRTKSVIAGIKKMCSTFRYVAPGFERVTPEEIDRQMEQSGVTYEASEGSKLQEPDIHEENVRYVIDPPLDISRILTIAPVMREAIKEAGRIVIDYDNIMPKKEHYYQANTAEGISIPIGLTGASEIQTLNLGMPGSQSVHALICGQIGSGKSRLLHAIVTGALISYTKEELEVYLIDFKSGTEFKIYADYNLPNFKVIAIESEQEFGLSVLRAIKQEGERRAQIFNMCTKSDITSYNNSPEASKYGKMSRVLIVIDEFHMLFSEENKEYADEASRLMEEILRLNRSFGFHLVLCSQSIRGMSALDEATLAQVAVRIALKCPREDAEILLGKGADAIAQIEENDAGSAIYLPSISTPNNHNKFRVGYLSPDRHKEILKNIEEHYNEIGEYTEARVLVSDVSDSRNSVFQRYYIDGEIISQNRVLHFGEPLKVESELEVRFEQTIANNMLLIGKNIQKAQNILFFATLDIVLYKVLQQRREKNSANIYVLNYCDGANTNFNDKLQELGMSVPQLIHYYDGAGAIGAIEALYERFDNKTSEDTDDWIVISNLALASYLSESSFNKKDSKLVSDFERMLLEGPGKGMFFIVWCDNPAIYRAKFGYTFEHFGKRIVFNVTPQDALEFADIVEDDSINRNNAYIWQEGKGKEKFRPYDAPMDSWFRRLCDECLCVE